MLYTWQNKWALQIPHLKLLYSSEGTFCSILWDARTREFPGTQFLRSHIKLHLLLTQPIQRACGSCTSWALHDTVLRHELSLGKLPGSWDFATHRTLSETSTIFQKSSTVWIFRKWKTAWSSFSLSEQTKVGSNHQLNIWLTQVQSFVLLTQGVSVWPP